MHTFTDGNKTFDVYRLWDIAPAQIEIPISIIAKDNLYEHIWGDKCPNILELLSCRCGEHWSRVVKCDNQYPIIVTPDFWVADGNHRLTKALYLNQTHIYARIFDSITDMKQAEISG